MNTEHTPGPWLAFQAKSEVGTNYWRIRTAPPESGLIDTIRGYCGEANARLITAAPDLLEALQATLAELRKFRRILVISVSHGERMGGWLEDVEGMIANIESAIAKAEGKS